MIIQCSQKMGKPNDLKVFGNKQTKGTVSPKSVWLLMPGVNKAKKSEIIHACYPKISVRRALEFRWLLSKCQHLGIIVKLLEIFNRVPKPMTSRFINLFINLLIYIDIS